MDVNLISQGGQSTLDYNLKQSSSTENVGTADNGAGNVQVKTANNQKTDEVKVKKAVETINKLLEGDSTHVEYEVHDVFKKDIIIKIIDNNTKQVIQEMPPKKLLDMVAKLCELAGLFVDKKA